MCGSAHRLSSDYSMVIDCQRRPLLKSLRRDHGMHSFGSKISCEMHAISIGPDTLVMWQRQPRKSTLRCQYTTVTTKTSMQYTTVTTKTQWRRRTQQEMCALMDDATPRITSEEQCVHPLCASATTLSMHGPNVVRCYFKKRKWGC